MDCFTIFDSPEERKSDLGRFPCSQKPKEEKRKSGMSPGIHAALFDKSSFPTTHSLII